jgi:UDP-N-acetylglucosamine diphosphorylase/glucosamine-1-phosphate N-acetyltransferase
LLILQTFVSETCIKMNLILFDDRNRVNLLPLTYTRPCSELRAGILTIREKWEKTWQTGSSWLTESYLSGKYPSRIENDNLLVNGTLLPDAQLVKALEMLETGQALTAEGVLLAVRTDAAGARSFQNDASSYSPVNYTYAFDKISAPWHIFSLNGKAIQSDYNLLTKGRKSARLSNTNRLLGAENIFAEESARVECSVLNATTGPIYLGSDSEIMEGSLVRGAFALCDHASLKLGTKVYGPSTVGPHSKVGGELSNSVITGYSNKAHDGFLGNSVIGEWCNLGADTNNSNLKNNYAEVKLWDYSRQGFVRTGLQFCGLIMGDHSKCGINTMFNTGTVVGVSANIFGSGFPRNFIPSYSWGGAQGFETFSIEKAFEVAAKVYERRGQAFDQTEKDILTHIFNTSASHRYWENQQQVKSI